MKTLLTLLISATTVVATAQVSFNVIAPASIAGGYDFTSNGDGTNWGLADLNDPNDAVLDTLVLVDDGTPGINAQGIPFANEGCQPLTPGSLAGKIAVVYRYDGESTNVCWYGTKVLNAQNAGAIGVVMINRDDALIDVPGTTDGPSTSIPFAFISKSDGAIIRDKMDNGETVVAFIGNKTGFYNNDLGIKAETTFSPKIAATATQTSQSAAEFNFEVGTRVYNYGSLEQTGVTITAAVTGPGTWTETVGPFTIPAGDSVEAFTGGMNNLPAFSLNNYPPGRYTLTYTIEQDSSDQMDFDNGLKYDFVLTDSLVAYCNLDPVTNMPVVNANYRPANSATYEMCMVYRDPNASRLGAHGIYFSAVTGYNSGVSLDGEEIGLTLYEWNDNFTDLNDPNFDFANISPLAYGFYYYPGDLQDSVVFGEFSNPVQLVDNQRYLACVQPFNGEIYMGHDTGIDYTQSVNTTLQPITPNNSDNGYFALGFGTDLTPSMALKVFDAAKVGLESLEENEVKVFPNPTTNAVTLQFAEAITGELTVYNILGEVVLRESINNLALRTIDVRSLTAGVYTLKITGDAPIHASFIKVAE